MWIVDDLTDEEDSAIGKFLAGFVGIFHGPVHAVAEAQALSHPKRKPADSKFVPGRLHRGDEVAAVFRLEHRLYLGLEPETFPKVCRISGHQCVKPTISYVVPVQRRYTVADRLAARPSRSTRMSTVAYLSSVCAARPGWPSSSGIISR